MGTMSSGSERRRGFLPARLLADRNQFHRFLHGYGGWGPVVDPLISARPISSTVVQHYPRCALPILTILATRTKRERLGAKRATKQRLIVNDRSRYFCAPMRIGILTLRDWTQSSVIITHWIGRGSPKESQDELPTTCCCGSSNSTVCDAHYQRFSPVRLCGARRRLHWCWSRTGIREPCSTDEWSSCIRRPRLRVWIRSSCVRRPWLRLWLRNSRVRRTRLWLWIRTSRVSRLQLWIRNSYVRRPWLQLLWIRLRLRWIRTRRVRGAQVRLRVWGTPVHSTLGMDTELYRTGATIVDHDQAMRLRCHRGDR